MEKGVKSPGNKQTYYDLFDDDLEVPTSANSDEAMVLYLTAQCPSFTLR